MLDPDLDKLQIVTVRLADTIHGFFAGNHPATTIDNARAISELTKGIRNFFYKQGKIKDTPLEYEKSYTLKFKRLSNFVKHADRDAHRIADLYDYEAHTTLNIAVNDYMFLLHKLLEAELINGKAIINDWLISNYGEGNSISLLCNVFNEWAEELDEKLSDIDGLSIIKQIDEYLELSKSSIDISNQNKKLQPDSKNEDSTTLKDNFQKMASILKEISEIHNEKEIKQEYHKIIMGLDVWPIKHNGGIAITNTSRDAFRKLIFPDDPT